MLGTQRRLNDDSDNRMPNVVTSVSLIDERTSSELYNEISICMGGIQESQNLVWGWAQNTRAGVNIDARV